LRINSNLRSETDRIVLSSLNLMRDSQLMTPAKLAMRVIVCGTMNKNASAHSPRGY